MIHTGYYVLAGDDQSTEEIIRRIIPELRKGYLCTSQDLNEKIKKVDGQGK
jgi:menaquinone-dependent protoporphyrinogen IX oxidase